MPNRSYTPLACRGGTRQSVRYSPAPTSSRGAPETTRYIPSLRNFSATAPSIVRVRAPKTSPPAPPPPPRRSDLARPCHDASRRSRASRIPTRTRTGVGHVMLPVVGIAVAVIRHRDVQPLRGGADEFVVAPTTDLAVGRSLLLGPAGGGDERPKATQNKKSV